MKKILSSKSQATNPKLKATFLYALCLPRYILNSLIKIIIHCQFSKSISSPISLFTSKTKFQVSSPKPYVIFRISQFSLPQKSAILNTSEIIPIAIVTLIGVPAWPAGMAIFFSSCLSQVLQL